MNFLTCKLHILSKLPLEDVGRIISSRVLGGIAFIGREDHIRDEIPAMYSEAEVFGVRLILTGEADDDGYHLESDLGSVISQISPHDLKRSYVDVSSLVGQLLKGADGIEIADP